MRLEEFIETVKQERPATLTASDMADVRPQPWVNRAGSGKDARIRMTLGGLRYERHQGEAVWRRVDRTSDFDVLDP
jgi:hypothetical protein